MKAAALACVVVLAYAGPNVGEVAEDESVMSLLQHSARPIHKIGDVALVDAPPTDAVARIQARREARKQNPDRTLTAEQKARRKARRSAKRQAHQQAKAAGQRHFDDSATCDICLAKCGELFQDIFKQCMLDAECQPWQKEDGPSADKCKKRCDRIANWQRAPCNRQCMCDADGLSLAETNDEIQSEVQPHWVGGHRRCRDTPLGQVSDCATVAIDRDSFEFDSIKKCSKAALAANADTFNFYRTSKEFGKCDLKNCGSEDLKIITAPAEPESPGGHGNWKVFSTFCPAPPLEERALTGEVLDADSSNDVWKRDHGSF